ncbi:MAG: chorismate-binding protein, partial [Pseudomonadota bacterium]
MLKRAQLRDAPSGEWLDFQSPEAVLLARLPEEVGPLLERVEQFCRQGGYAAGYLAYEAAAAFDRAFPVAPEAEHGTVPLAVFGLFAAPQRRTRPEVARQAGGRWRLEESFDRYRDQIARLRREIGCGNVYQVNYTVRASGAAMQGDARLAAEAARAPFGAFLDLGSASVISASPELFFELEGSRLRSIPMKGTAARGKSPRGDDAQRRWLQESLKNRAENLMITDMVRNDLGRVALTGTVRTEDVFAVRDYATVWQMTSEVRAQTRASLGEVFAALFPAASITGAPKLASAALIHELETGPRGIYTGSIGFVAPHAQGFRAQFNVAIRTAWFDHTSGTGSYGVGGGIVWDSEAREEYAEIATKMQVLSDVTRVAAVGAETAKDRTIYEIGDEI